MDRYNRFQPFHAPLKDKILLTKPGSLKETWHIVLDITGSGISYKVGDSIAVLASHDPQLVEKTLNATKFSGQETVICKKTKRPYTLREYFTSYVSITRMPPSLTREPYELWDYAEENSLPYTPQELVDLLPPLLPRFYSIASAQELTPGEIHLTVVMTAFETRGHKRLGVGTHFLCHLADSGTKIPLYPHPSKDFTIPHPEADLIMVGPGTGVAPFRGFMQKRMVEGHTGKNWLFFGEQKRAHDFLYEDFWTELAHKGHLSLSLAFSRDQDEKIYVQHRMLEEAEMLWQWLESGSHFFVCGDASRMAKDVEEALLQIAQSHGGHSAESSRLFIKNLRKSGRYLRDIY
jgi:sulfite reductase (NADPH) flavoprotein alpha-component